MRVLADRSIMAKSVEVLIRTGGYRHALGSMSVRAIGFILALAAVVLTGGCGGGKALNPGTFEVDLRVVAIVGSGESLGNAGNDGCRLSQAEITAIMQQAINNASVFGANTQFNWDGTVNVRTDFNSGNYGRAGTVSDFQFLLLFPQFEPDPSFINIYFMGNFANPGSPVFGAAIEPQVAGQFSPGYVRINDGGFQFGAADPATLQSQLILEHELGHYLGNSVWAPNRVGQTFGTGAGQRVYDNFGHITVQGAPYLMLDGGFVVGNARVLNVPGQQVDANGNGGSDELGGVSRRIYLGLWNQP